VKDESGAHVVTTLSGASLQADRVILATHLPIMDRSGHFTMFSPSKSHVVAVKLAQGDGTHKKVGAGDVRGMYINCDPEKRSIRTLQDASVLIVSGESFETGDETDVEKRYISLEEWAAKHFAVEKNLTRWSAMVSKGSRQAKRRVSANSLRDADSTRDFLLDRIITLLPSFRTSGTCTAAPTRSTPRLRSASGV
jgi:hypothetical protein